MTAVERSVVTLEVNGTYNKESVMVAGSLKEIITFDENISTFAQIVILE